MILKFFRWLELNFFLSKLVYKYQMKNVFSVLWIHFFTFFTFLKNTPEYIDPSGHFVFYEILCSSTFFCRTPPIWCSRGSPGGLIKLKIKKITKLVDKNHKKIHRKSRMIALYMTEIFNFLSFGKKKKTSYRSFQIFDLEI